MPHCRNNGKNKDIFFISKEFRLIELYHYVHCPYCIRVRMVLGFFEMPFQSIVIPYDDEETPVALAGKKMLPIVNIDGKILNESLDIIAMLDKNNILKAQHYQENQMMIDQLLADISKPLHNLAMPYWIWTPEFDDHSRNYFRIQKEKKRGPFENLVSRQDEFKMQLEQVLIKHGPRLRPYFDSDELTLIDIVIAAQLWGAYVVPEWQFPPGWHEYLQSIKDRCRFNYHQDFWAQKIIQTSQTVGVLA